MSIKSLIKNYDKSYVLEDLELISLDIKEKSEVKKSKKKIKNILCKYSDIDDGKIIFKSKKNDDMTFEKLSESFYQKNNLNKINNNKIGGIRLNFLNNLNKKDKDSDYEYISNDENESDKEEFYEFPNEEKKLLNRNNDLNYGPFGSQWYHDNQKDDKLNKVQKRRRKVERNEY